MEGGTHTYGTCSPLDETSDPVNITLFAVNGQLLGRVIARRGATSVYTAEFHRSGITGVSFCRVQVGKYKKIQCLIAPLALRI